MAKARLPDWMTGAETWDHLKGIYPDRTDREVRIMLHSAVKDCRVNGRLVGRNAEENLFAARGIVGDVEGDWIRDFILRDPDEVDWDTFLRRTNFLRKDVLKSFGTKSRPRIVGSEQSATAEPISTKRHAAQREAAVSALVELYPDKRPLPTIKVITGQINEWLRERGNIQVGEDTVSRALKGFRPK